MKAIVFELSIFDRSTTVEASEETLAVLLIALTAANCIYLRTHPDTPEVYDGGVRYVREGPGVEKWKGIAKIREDGFADCEDLACYRAAWAIVRQNRPGTHVTFSVRVMPNGFRMYHIFVEYPDGSTEDPSARLGMYATEESQWVSY